MAYEPSKKEIEKNMRLLGISYEKSRQMCIDDYNDVETDEMREMGEKAKKFLNTVHGAGDKTKRKKGTPAPRKPDENKRLLIAGLEQFMLDFDGATAVDVTNIERMIAFEYEGDRYEIMLTKKRPKKK